MSLKTLPAENGRSSIRQDLLSWQFVLLLTIATVTLFGRFFRPHLYGYFEDDFYYYLLPASNLVHHGISSFDGIHLTNGYHPLWFLVLTALIAVSSGTTFLFLVQVVTLAALASCYVLLLRVFAELAMATSLRRGLALLLSLQILLLFRYGMEVTVAIPLGLAALAYNLQPGFRWTPKQSMLFGLLACLTVLGRLDNIILFTLIVSGQLLVLEVSWVQRLRAAGLFCLGFSPFLVYLAVNRHFFGVFLPISGSAKQLKPLWPLSPVPFETSFLPFDWMKLSFAYPSAVLLLIGVVLFARNRHAFTRRLQVTLAAMLAFPIAHVAALSLLSDWPIWAWYYYVYLYSTLAACTLLFGSLSATPKRLGLAVPAAGRIKLVISVAVEFYSLYLLVYATTRKPNVSEITGEKLAEYMKQHPGLYAMGDGAGAPAYLSGQPVMQLEGLVMDKEYLQTIRGGGSLAKALSDRNVRYYIVLDQEPKNGCYHLREPANAGAASPHLTATTCATPLLTISERGQSVALFNAGDLR